MMDFELMDKALKIAWIKRITENVDAAWKVIPEFAAAHYGGLSFLTECQYDIKYLHQDNLPPFYHTLLKYWQEYNTDKFSDESLIQNKIIWNNSCILVNGRPIFNKTMFKAQIIRVKHFLKENQNFLSLDELSRKFNINIPFTVYYGIISAIPTKWKKLLRNEFNLLQTVIPSQDLPSTRTAYSALLINQVNPPTSEIRILNYGFTKENIHKVYTLPFAITKDSKLIAFHPPIPIREVDEPPNSDNQEAKKDLDLNGKFYIQNGRSVARQNQIKERRLLDAINEMQPAENISVKGYRRSQGGMFSKVVTSTIVQNQHHPHLNKTDINLPSENDIFLYSPYTRNCTVDLTKEAVIFVLERNVSVGEKEIVLTEEVFAGVNALPQGTSESFSLNSTASSKTNSLGATLKPSSLFHEDFDLEEKGDTVQHVQSTKQSKSSKSKAATVPAAPPPPISLQDSSSLLTYNQQVQKLELEFKVPSLSHPKHPQENTLEGFDEQVTEPASQ
ncbi:hypothetical protein ACROYT_G014797 [Oculina patagonica]